jgi:hypothetical protein
MRVILWIRLVLLVLLIGLLSACGGGEADSETPPTDPTAAPAKVEAEAATATPAPTTAATAPPVEAAPAAARPIAPTVAQIAALLDLRSLPWPEGATPTSPSQIGNGTGTVPRKMAELLDFYRAQLTTLGWQELADKTQTDNTSYAVAFFVRDGYGLSLSATDMGGSANVTLLHHGNIEAGTLPQTADAEPGYSSLNQVIFFSPTSVVDAAKFIRDELIAQGWHLYSRPNTATTDSTDTRVLDFINNGLVLNVLVNTAPAQAGKTAVQYNLGVAPLDLPLVDDASAVELAFEPPYLTYKTPADIQPLVKTYRAKMTDLGWTEVADSAILSPEQAALSFAHSQDETVLQLNLSKTDGQTTVTLQTGPGEGVVLAVGPDNESADIIAMESTPTAGLPDIALPDNAENVAYDPDAASITFDSAADVAAIVDFFRQSLTGWQEDKDFAVETDTFASVDFIRGDESINLTIFDIGGSLQTMLDLSSAPSLGGGSSAETDSLADMPAEAPTPDPDAPKFTIQDWPTPSEAFNVNLSGEKLSYKTSQKLAEVAEFYRPTFELMELGDSCLDGVADYTSISCSSGNGNVMLNFFAYEGMDNTEVEIEFTNYNYPLAGSGSAAGDSGELFAEDKDGLPVPGENNGYSDESTDFSRRLTVLSSADSQTMQTFYEAELANRGWKLETTAAEAGITTMTFSGEAGELKVVIRPSTDSSSVTEVDLTSKNPDAAAKAGILPPTGQARIYLINLAAGPVTALINDQTFNLAVGAGIESAETAGKLDVPPGSYKITVTANGKSVTDTVDVAADETWSLLLDENGAGPMQMY